MAGVWWSARVSHFRINILISPKFSGPRSGFREGSRERYAAPGCARGISPILGSLSSPSFWLPLLSSLFSPALTPHPASFVFSPMTFEVETALRETAVRGNQPASLSEGVETSLMYARFRSMASELRVRPAASGASLCVVCLVSFFSPTDSGPCHNLCLPPLND